MLTLNRTAKVKAKQMMPVFAGIPILGVNYGGADYRAPPGRGGESYRSSDTRANRAREGDAGGAFFPLTPRSPLRRGRGCRGDTWMGDAAFMVRGGLD